MPDFMVSSAEKTILDLRAARRAWSSVLAGTQTVRLSTHVHADMAHIDSKRKAPARARRVLNCCPQGHSRMYAGVRQVGFDSDDCSSLIERSHATAEDFEAMIALVERQAA